MSLTEKEIESLSKDQENYEEMVRNNDLLLEMLDYFTAKKDANNIEKANEIFLKVLDYLISEKEKSEQNS